MNNRIKVKVIPNAKKNEIVGQLGDVLKIKLKAPAVEGKANAALVEFLAEKFGVKKNQVKIMAGLRSRQKIIKIGERP